MVPSQGSEGSGISGGEPQLKEKRLLLGAAAGTPGAGRCRRWAQGAKMFVPEVSVDGLGIQPSDVVAELRGGRKVKLLRTPWPLGLWK